jgi:hypothetical protein
MAMKAFLPWMSAAAISVPASLSSRIQHEALAAQGRGSQPRRRCGILTEMLSSLAKDAKKEKISLAPVVGVGYPGLIEKDGSITRGAQNLPGNWENKKFNLPSLICQALKSIGEPPDHGRDA